jgi:hypothetical protein
MRTLVWFISLLFVCDTAFAFVVQGPRRPTGNPLEDLAQAPRWDAAGGSLVETGARGLGGGLEYAIDESVCQLRFVDGSTCADAQDMIAEAARRWEAGHTNLRFADVTGLFTPTPPKVSRDSTRQEGAEIDIMAAGSASFGVFQNGAITAYTILYSEPERALTRTDGSLARLVDGRASSADLWINSDRCYYLKPEAQTIVPPQCVHFGTMILHELGHTIGLDHPDGAPGMNIQALLRRGFAARTASAPDTHPSLSPPSMGCSVTAADLLPHPQIDGQAVMIGSDVWKPRQWLSGLTADDLAGRDALYPNCG